jgi:hypothetical protein
MAARLNRSAWFYAACLLIILLLYGLLSFYQITLPGLHYDEAFEAVPAVQLLQGQPVTAFRESGLTLVGQTFPLMTQDYIGALNTYAALPFIALFGPTPTALRTMSIITGALTLLLTTALATRLTRQRWVGLTAALLLAVDPTFIFWNRQGVFVTAVTATIGIAATYCWLRRFESNRQIQPKSQKEEMLSKPSPEPVEGDFGFGKLSQRFSKESKTIVLDSSPHLPTPSGKETASRPAGRGGAISSPLLGERVRVRGGLAGAFLFGLGLYAKFLFLWLIFALVGAVILLNLDWLIKNRRGLGDAIKQISIGEVISWGIAFYSAAYL